MIARPPRLGGPFWGHAAGSTFGGDGNEREYFASVGLVGPFWGNAP